MPSIRLKMVKGFGNKQEEIDKYEYYGTHRFCEDLYNAIIYDTSVCEYFILDNNKFMAEKLKIDDQKNR